MKRKSEPVYIKGADGKLIKIDPGEWYINTKDRTRRMMANSLSLEARRVYACLELATMGFKRELALTKDGDGERPLTRSDIAKQTGLSEAHVRRAIVELEEVGLAERRGLDDGPLHKGRVEIYSWAVPRSPQRKKREPRAAPIPEWFPPSWKSLEPLIKRLKLSVSITSGEVPDSFLSEGAEVAAVLKQAEEQARKFLTKICARQNGHAAEAEKGASAPPENPPEKGASAPPNGVSALQNGVSAPSKNGHIIQGTQGTQTTASSKVQEQQQQQPETAPPEIVVVAQKLNAFGTIVKPAVQKFVNDCQKASPGCTANDITAVIDQIGSTLGPRTRNPIGVLITNVPPAIAVYRKEAHREASRLPSCHICTKPLDGGVTIQGAHFACYNARGPSS